MFGRQYFDIAQYRRVTAGEGWRLQKENPNYTHATMDTGVVLLM